MVVSNGGLAARSAATTIRIAKSDISKTFHELPYQDVLWNFDLLPMFNSHKCLSFDEINYSFMHKELHISIENLFEMI